MSKFGICECGYALAPVWFIEEEEEESRFAGEIVKFKTGRKRKAVDALICMSCLREYPVDDSFDGPWYREKPGK